MSSGVHRYFRQISVEQRSRTNKQNFERNSHLRVEPGFEYCHFSFLSINLHQSTNIRKSEHLKEYQDWIEWVGTLSPK